MTRFDALVVGAGPTGLACAIELQQRGIETVIIGPAGAGAHSDHEWVDLESTVQLAQILVEAAADFCA